MIQIGKHQKESIYEAQVTGSGGGNEGIGRGAEEERKRRTSVGATGGSGDRRN